VDGVVVEAGSEDAVVGIGQNGGQGDEAGSLWPVEHLGLEPGELVLEVGEILGQGLDDGRVHCPDDGLLGGPQVLGTILIFKDFRFFRFSHFCASRPRT